MLGLLLALILAQFGQTNTGELRLLVTDASGLPLQGAVELVSDANQVREQLETALTGGSSPGACRSGPIASASCATGLRAFAGMVEIRSALPTEYRVTLSLAPVQSQVTVTAGDTLLDLHQTATINRVGADTLQQRMTALPGRSLPDLVNTQPGWLLEANGILHPRGSEYQTQYVVDGLPMTDNRSPAFAPEIDADDVHGDEHPHGRISRRVRPQARRRDRGRHRGRGPSWLPRQRAVAAGSFATRSRRIVGAYSWPRDHGERERRARGDRSVSRSAGRRELHQSRNHVACRPCTSSATSPMPIASALIVRRGDADSSVPNERVQQEAGQRQDRDSGETARAVLLSAHLLGARCWRMSAAWRATSRPGSASNARIHADRREQDRGFRELYLKGTIAGHAGAHEWKAGGDVDAGTRARGVSRIRSRTPIAFEPARRRDFCVRRSRAGTGSRRCSSRTSCGAARWTVNAGLRWDHYRLVVDGPRAQPAARRRLVVAGGRPRRAGLVRSRVSNAGGRESPAGQLAATSKR